MPVSVRTKKDDLPAYLKKLAERYSVTVGIHEAEGSEPKREPEHKAQEKEQADRFREAGREDTRAEKMAAKLANFKGTAKARAKLEARLGRARQYREFMAGRAETFARERSEAEASGQTLIEVAEDHEFGLTVPERSFIRAPVDATEDELKSKLAASLKTALKPGGRGAEQQMARFGLYVVGQLQQNIADGIPPELSPRTLAYKRSLNLAGNAKETPLILTGQLRSSIRSKVERTK